MKKYIIFSVFFLALVLAGCGDDNGTNGDDNGTEKIPRLVVDTMATAPTLSDANEAVWFTVDSVLVEIGGDPANYGQNISLQKQNAVMRAIKKSDTIYIWVRWHDPSGADLWANYIRKPDSSSSLWEHVTTEGQDMFFILFDNQDNGTEGADCATMCHPGEGMKTTGGGMADAWRWMSTCTMPGKMADDIWWDGATPSTDTADATINKYVFRDNDDGNRPRYVHEDTMLYTGVFLYIEDTLKYNPLEPTRWPTGHRIPGFVTDSSIYGAPDRNDNSRNNVRAIAIFDSTGSSTGWTWTVAFARALNTGYNDDVDLSTLDSVQVTVAATNDHPQETFGGPKPAHSGSKPFYIILKP